MITWVGVEGEDVVPQMSIWKTVMTTLHAFYLLPLSLFIDMVKSKETQDGK
jgi:hypothetical protein